MTRRDKWAKRACVLRYFAFRDEVLAHGVIIPDRVRIIFHMPMPDSWSKKKRASMEGAPHKARPDIDNLCKALLDAVFDDDSHVWDVHASKLWSVDGAIEIGQIAE